MKKLSFSLIVFLALFFMGSSYAQYIPEQGYQLNVLSTTPTSTIIEYKVSDYRQEQKIINGEIYIDYNIPGMVRLMEKGFPQLPMMRRSIIIPDLAGMNFRILEQEFTSITTDPVAPSKGHFTRDIDPESVPYTFDPFYKTNTWYPEKNVSLDVPYIVRDLRGLTVQFNPMQYNPALKELKICTSIRIEVYQDAGVAAVNPLIRIQPFKGVSKDFSDIYQSLFVNYGYPNYDYVPIPEPGRLLIIYPAAFASTITPFYNWKVERGIPTLLAEYPTQTGSGSAAIKTYIQNLYNSTEGLTYIILIGEAAQIPTLNGVYEGAPSDPCYVKLAGTDAYPDAYISRISPTSAANLSYVLWKFIRYEKYPDTGAGAAWYLKGTGVASNEGSPPDWTYANTLRDMLMGQMYFTNVDQIYDPGATSTQVTTALNNGRSVLNYIGHGSGTSWGTTGYSNSQIHALSNGYKNPFIIDVACLNGDFTMGECMEEAWIRAGDSVNAKGAIAVYGSSTNASWTPPLDMQYHAMYLMVNRMRQTVGGICFNGVMYGMDVNGGSSGEGLKMMEQYNIFGDCTMLLTFGLIPDSTAPAQITNLALNTPTSNSLTVNWTSPYDSSIGGVVSYDLRYSTTPITNNTQFNNAPSIIIPGGPDSAGIARSYALDSLPFTTTYYAAMKSRDIWGNVSEMSNVPSAVTLSAPQISVNTDSMYCLMLQNETEIDTIILSNVSIAGSTLDYNIELANNTFPDGITTRLIPINKPVDIYEKGQIDNDYGMSFLGHGGPDLFGYEWIDSNEPNGPEFIWEDISTTGTLVNNWVATSTWPAVDEGKAGPFQLGFNFKFYGVPYTQFWISSNGWLSFTDITDAAMTNGPLPSTSTPNGMIAAIWDDLDGKTTGKVYYKQETNRFIIQYHNWPGYSATTGPFTFQVILYKSGKIMVYYKTISGTSTSCTVGIENQTGTDGLQVVNGAAYLANDLALQFSAEPDWLEPSVNAGCIYNGNSVAIQLTLNSDGLELGQYSMDFIIHSNDPVTPAVTIPIVMYVWDGTPVELSGIEARSSEDQVIIEWTTQTETNNKGFQIDKQVNDVWQSLKFINGKGTTTEMSAYSFTERVSKTGKQVYRLQQIDLNGTIQLSRIIEVDVNGPDKFSLSQNYPNPFNPSTTIKFAVPEQSNVRLSVFNLLGEEIAVLADNIIDEGYYTFNWNAARYSSGLYILLMDAKALSGKQQFRNIKKMTLIK